MGLGWVELDWIRVEFGLDWVRFVIKELMLLEKKRGVEIYGNEKDVDDFKNRKRIATQTKSC
jgi:hypothetical protein